jgi:hypothetical protein
MTKNKNGSRLFRFESPVFDLFLTVVIQKHQVLCKLTDLISSMLLAHPLMVPLFCKFRYIFCCSDCGFAIVLANINTLVSFFNSHASSFSVFDDDHCLLTLIASRSLSRLPILRKKPATLHNAPFKLALLFLILSNLHFSCNFRLSCDL